MNLVDKKRVAVLITAALILFSILNLNIVRGADDVLAGTGMNNTQVEGVADQIGGVADKFGDPSISWTYMGGELQKMLLQNPIVKGIDSFLNKIDIVFVILLGTGYSMSVSFFFIFLTWILFFFLFDNILINFSMFSKWVARAASFLLVIMMGQLKVFEMLIKPLMFLLFGTKPWWFKLIIWAAIVIAPVVIFYVIKIVGKNFKANRKKMKEAEHMAKLQLGAATGEAFANTVGKALSREAEKK